MAGPLDQAEDEVRLVSGVVSAPDPCRNQSQLQALTESQGREFADGLVERLRTYPT